MIRLLTEGKSERPELFEKPFKRQGVQSVTLRWHANNIEDNQKNSRDFRAAVFLRLSHGTGSARKTAESRMKEISYKGVPEVRADFACSK